MPLKIAWPHPAHPSFLWRLQSRLSIIAVGTISKFWTHCLNTTHIYNGDALVKSMERPEGVPLITVCNHTSCLDDPLVWGATLNWRHLITHCMHYMRWTLAASDVCYNKSWHARFFSCGRGVPVVRGDGVYQIGQDFVLEQLNKAGWAHTFPEGGINMTNEFKRLKWGVGRLVADANVTPSVLPFWHVGMEEILPNYRPYIPRIGKTVTIVMGEPMDFSGLVSQMKSAQMAPREIRKAITDKIQDEFFQLKMKAERLHATHTNSETVDIKK